MQNYYSSQLITKQWGKVGVNERDSTSDKDSIRES